MALIFISLAWAAGIFLGSKLNLPPVLLFAGLAFLPFLLRFPRRRKALVIASLCVIAVIGGAARFGSVQTPADEVRLEHYNGRQVELRGVVAADPEASDKSLQLRLDASEIKLDGGWEEISGSAMLFMPRWSGYEYGDVLHVRGRLETPPRLGDFDYREYLANQGVRSTMLYPTADTLERGRGSPFLGWVYSVRKGMARALAQALPEPQASLAQGMVLGLRGNIPPALKADLSRTGTAHILAISGLNISIVAGILLSLGVWLFGRRRRLYIWLALAAIWFYSLLTGMDAPVVRSAIMASLFLAAEGLGRQRSALPALAFAAAVMVGLDPLVLWTASFQMSFLSMAGLVLLAPPLMNAGRRAVAAVLGEEGAAVKVASAIADSLAVSLGAIAAVYPVIAYYFGIVSLVSPLATLLALPVLPGIMVVGALTGALGLAALPLAYISAWLAWLLISWMLLVVQLFALAPGYILVAPGNAALVAGCYAALAGVVWAIARRRRLLPAPVLGNSGVGGGFPEGKVKLAAVALVALAALGWAAAATMPDDNLHVSFLDVGEGDAIFIQTPARQDILIDGGASAQALKAGLGEKMPFWDRAIDLVVLTHPHADHLTGLVEVVQRYNVGMVLLPASDDGSALYTQWLALLEEKGLRCESARAGQEFRLGGGAALAVLAPGGEDSPRVGDDGGTVLRLSMGEHSFLFAADIGREVEWELISDRAELASTVLKVAHHGSEGSTSAGFLAAAKPRLAVISSGAGNRYGHPHPETLARLEGAPGMESVYRTDSSGTVEFITDGTTLRVRLWTGSPD